MFLKKSWLVQACVILVLMAAGCTGSQPSANADASPSSADVAPAPVCPHLKPLWAANVSHPNDGVPDPAGRIVFGPVDRFDTILGQQISPLFAMDADGSDLVQIYDCELERPRISPDGSRIAFSILMDDESWQVATIAADGSDLHILTSTTGYAETPDWSPDGSWLIYATSPMKCSRDPLCDSLHETLWRMNADGSDQRQIGNPAASVWDWEPRLSPDGREVVFVRERGEPAHDDRFVLMIRNLETGQERVATVDTRDLEHPDWSRDGRFIIYHKEPGGPIERIPADDPTATPEILAGDASSGFYKPAYSPDAKNIVFGCDGSVCRIAADGSKMVVLVEAPPGVEFNHFAWGVAPPVDP